MCGAAQHGNRALAEPLAQVVAWEPSVRSHEALRQQQHADVRGKPAGEPVDGGH
jgi:hypothetical protein